MDNTLLKIENLNVSYKSSKGILGISNTVQAVNNLSLEINKGEIFAIAGESGCGKSTLSKTIIGLVKPTSGHIYFENSDITKINDKEFKDIRKKIQMIFQDPYASLNPKMKIYDILKEPLKINTNLTDNEIREKVIETAGKVGIDEECLDLYPHEFSGGQRQRIAIARALILNPDLILADEPVSALDVSIQAQIINLLKDLKNEYMLTFLFISHDLSVIKYISDRIGIMYLGEIVETGTSDEIFFDPKHPYTKALLNAAPRLDKTHQEETMLKSDLPTDIPLGCKFHTRCPYCMAECREKQPDETKITDTHYVKCFLMV